VSHQQPPQDLC